MRGLPASAAWVLLALFAIVGSAPGFSARAWAKEKPLLWKAIEVALLRVNDAPPKDWSVYRVGKKNEPLVLRIGTRFLLIDSRDHQVFELDPAKIVHKTGEVRWSVADRPAKPLATSNWNVDDIGAAFVVKVKLDKENAAIDLQLPHPPNVGSLPDLPPQPEQPF